MQQKDYNIAAYYFPNFHSDPRNNLLHGKGWSEWELVKRAIPRFEGHKQPKVPVWGYEDESNPEVMARKIDCAAQYGITHFIYDWYYYEDGPFLNRCLDEGYLQAGNNDKVGFSLMFANHDWTDVHPAKLSEIKNPVLNGRNLNDLGNNAVLFPGAVSRKCFETIVDLVIERYFKHPAYWKIDDAPYFAIYDFRTLITGLGGIENTIAALKYFREKVLAAGFKDLHLVAMKWRLGDGNDYLKEFGIKAVTTYHWGVWALGKFPKADYAEAIKIAQKTWNGGVEKYKSSHCDYYIDVTTGYDVSPRSMPTDIYEDAGYPYRHLYHNSTPELFKDALSKAKDYIEQNQLTKTLTINAWNEWTEGAYLEPDNFYGYRYLEAVRDIFGQQT